MKILPSKIIKEELGMRQMSTPHSTDSGSGKVSALMVHLAVPTVIAQLVNMLYNIVDCIYIGHNEGDQEDRLVRRRAMFPHYYADFRFYFFDGCGRCTFGLHRDGQRGFPIESEVKYFTEKNLTLTPFTICFYI